MAKNAMDLMRSMGNNPGRVTINGSVKAHTKSMIDTLAKKTKMSNGEVIDAMADLFFEGFDAGPEAATTKVETPEEEESPLPSQEAGPEPGSISDNETADSDNEGAADDDPQTGDGPDVESGEPLERPLPGTHRPTVVEDGEGGSAEGESGGNPGSAESSEAGSLDDRNAGYPQNLEIF